MSIKEKILHFWFVTLGPDVEEKNISDMPELEESLKRVEDLEVKFEKPTSNKAGKGGKSGIDIQKVETDVEKAVEDSKSKVEPEKEEKTR